MESFGVMNKKSIPNRQPDPHKAAAGLESLDVKTRARARLTLAALGPAALPQLHQALNHPAEWVRWEAASSLGMIADPQSAEALVRLLQDESPSVRQAASEALIAIGPAALRPLQEEINRSLLGKDVTAGQHPALIQEAHRILHSLYLRNQLGTAVYPLYAWLHGLTSDESHIPGNPN